MSGVLLSGLALAAATLGGDTTVVLQRGDRVLVDGVSGELVVRAWDRSELRVAGEDDETAVGVARTGSTVRVRAEDPRGRRRSYDVTMWVPAWADVEVRGRSLDVSVSGIGGSLDVSVFDGDVDVSESAGPVSLRTEEGEIIVRGARGRVVARSEGDDIRIIDVQGSVTVESGSGDIVLARVDAETVRAETLDGDVTFDGEVRPGGSYAFYVHDGDVRLALPRQVGARVRVSTFDGEFTSEFPVTVERFSGVRSFEFVMGDGSASIEVEVFDGEISLHVRR